MRKVILLFLMLLMAFASSAQKRPLNPAPTFADIDSGTYAEKLKYCYSREGIRNWKPEVTVRLGVTLAVGGFYAGSLGVRVNDRSTFGIKGLWGSFYYDSFPAHTYWAGGALFARRTLPFGKRAIVSLSNELTAGVGCYYKVYGDEDTYFATLDRMFFHRVNKGDFIPLLGWQPTLKIRIYRNLHIFLGANVSTIGLGPVLGIGL